MRLAAILVSCLTVPTAGVHAQGSISVTSLGSATIPAFGMLTVNGAGFDTAGSAISVIVTPRGGAPETIPVYAATAASVTVVVPPLFSVETGDLFDTPVVATVQVVQVNRTTVRTSNVLGGLTISPAPQLVGPVGTATSAFLKTMIGVAADHRATVLSLPRGAELTASVDAQAEALAATLAAVAAVGAGRGRLALMPTVNDQTSVLSEDALRTSDRLVLAYVGQAVRALTAGTPSSQPMAGETACACTGVPESGAELANDLCLLRTRQCEVAKLGRSLAIEAAQFIYGIPFTALKAGALIKGTAKALTVSDAAWGALLGGEFTYAWAINNHEKPPPLKKVVIDQSVKMVEDLVFDRAPIARTVYDGLKLAKKAADLSGEVSDTAEKGGLVVNSKSDGGTTGGQTADAYLSDTAGATTISLPSTPSTQTFASATNPPATSERFNGTYTRVDKSTTSITYPGGELGFQDLETSTSSMSVENGAIGGSSNATVSNSGYYASTFTSADGMKCTEFGKFWREGKEGGASGSAQCTYTSMGAKVSIMGTWTATRVP